MNQMATNKTFSTLAFLSILPLFFALCLALYAAFDGAAYTGYRFSFARINAYIYAHSYGALLLVLFAGIQIGQSIQSHQRWYVIFNFVLMWLAWLSFHSFADAQGIMLLTCAWLAASLIDYQAFKQGIIEADYIGLKLKLDAIVMILLLLLLQINR